MWVSERRETTASSETQRAASLRNERAFAEVAFRGQLCVCVCASLIYTAISATFSLLYARSLCSSSSLLHIVYAHTHTHRRIRSERERENFSHVHRSPVCLQALNTRLLAAPSSSVSIISSFITLVPTYTDCCCCTRTKSTHGKKKIQNNVSLGLSECVWVLNVWASAFSITIAHTIAFSWNHTISSLPLVLCNCMYMHVFA